MYQSKKESALFDRSKERRIATGNRNVRVAVEHSSFQEAFGFQEEADMTKQLSVSADELEIKNKGEHHHFQSLQQQKGNVQMKLQNLESKKEKDAELRHQHQAEKGQRK